MVASLGGEQFAGRVPAAGEGAQITVGTEEHVVTGPGKALRNFRTSPNPVSPLHFSPVVYVLFVSCTCNDDKQAAPMQMAPQKGRPPRQRRLLGFAPVLSVVSLRG